MKKSSLIILIVCINTLSLLHSDSIYNIGFHLDSSVARNTIGIDLRNNIFQLNVDVSTSYPNLAFMIMNDSNWEFKYHSTSKNDMFLHSLFYYNSLNVNALIEIVNKDDFYLYAGPELDFEYFNGNRLGLSSKHKAVALKLSGKVEYSLTKSIAIYGKVIIPFVDIVFTDNQRTYSEFRLLEKSSWRYILYNASIGCHVRFGGAV